MITDGKLEWFGGNEDALAVFRMFVRLAHVWDDLVDKDKPVSEDAINEAFLICLVYMPSNSFYRHIQDVILPMWITVVSAYKTANQFEKNKDKLYLSCNSSFRFCDNRSRKNSFAFTLSLEAFLIYICHVK